VEVPAELFDAIDHIADEMVGTRTAAVLALLNEGLIAFNERRDEFPSSPPATKRPRRGRPAHAVADR
jgi:hypothetical protein